MALLFCTVAPAPAWALAGDDAALDANTLAGLEQRAEHAQAREQCYLYTELAHELTELAGKQMAAGEDDKAAQTILQVDKIAAQIEKSATDAKRLKNAEELLDRTTHRLSDMLRVASDQQRSIMQKALGHLNAVHSSVLALVFAQ